MSRVELMGGKFMRIISIVENGGGHFKEYKYLGVHLDSKIAWTENTDKRSDFLKRLWSSNSCRTLQQMFDHLVVWPVSSSTL